MVYTAAFILALTGVLHSYIGERKLLGPLFRLEPKGILAAPRARRILRGAWHLMSVALVAVAWLLAQAVGVPFERTAILVTLALCAISAVVCLLCAGPKHPGAIAFSISAALLAASRF